MFGRDKFCCPDVIEMFALQLYFSKTDEAFGVQL
jgi:hypothetical protein